MLPAVSPRARHRSPNRRPRPCCEPPRSSPPSAKKVRRAWSKLFPSLLFFLQLSTNPTILFSCSGGRTSKREVPSRGTLVWQPVLTSYCQSFWSPLHFPLLSICKLPAFLRETVDPFFARGSACTNCLGILTPGLSGELPVYAVFRMIFQGTLNANDTSCAPTSANTLQRTFPGGLGMTC